MLSIIDKAEGPDHAIDRFAAETVWLGASWSRGADGAWRACHCRHHSDPPRFARPIPAHFGPIQREVGGQTATISLQPPPSGGPSQLTVQAFNGNATMTVNTPASLVDLLIGHGLPLVLTYVLFLGVLFDLFAPAVRQCRARRELHAANRAPGADYRWRAHRLRDCSHDHQWLVHAHGGRLSAATHRNRRRRDRPCCYRI